MSVSKTQLATDLAELQGLTKTAAVGCIDSLLSLILGVAASGEKIIIQGFGTFEMKTRAARTGRNPATGLPVEIAAKTSLTFKPVKAKG